MRVQTEEWRRFIPGVRMYKGKKTLFYNGEILVDDEIEENEGYLLYNREERQSWEVIIVLPGVEIIPDGTFSNCDKIEAVIMSDTVRRIEDTHVFYGCYKLSYVRLSRNLEYIGDNAFMHCHSLTSIFIPPTCTKIGNYAFGGCERLIIFSAPHQTQFGHEAIGGTAFIEAFSSTNEEVSDLIRHLHADNRFSLHRACSSYNPLDEVILGIIKRQGLKPFQEPDRVGVTALQYLYQNPYSEVKEQKIIKRYILDLMGEII